MLVRAKTEPWSALLSARSGTGRRRPLLQKSYEQHPFNLKLPSNQKTVSTENQTEAKPRQRLKTLTAVDRRERFYKIQYHEQRIKRYK